MAGLRSWPPCWTGWGHSAGGGGARPPPPHDLQPRHVQAMGSTELGSAVHAALAAWHTFGGDLLALYSGPEAGREMLARYLTHPLARAKTLAGEVGFNMP